ncbi:hypothetical protein SFUMM280S_03470 [Streptomyces fumanus]
MPVAEAATYRFNPFDLTKVWPHADYPIVGFSKLELNRNPENIFAEVEQSIFSPAHFVPGIGPSPDKMLQGRLFAYGDAHRYRVGINADHLPVNRPRATEARTHARDGYLYDGRHKGAKNYEPNSFGGPFQTDRPLWQPVAVTGVTGETEAPVHAEDNDFVQAGNLYRLMTEDAEGAPDQQPGGLHLQGLARGHSSSARSTTSARRTSTSASGWRPRSRPCAADHQHWIACRSGGPGSSFTQGSGPFRLLRRGRGPGPRGGPCRGPRRCSPVRRRPGR